VAGGWRTLHSEEIQTLHFSQNIIENEMGRACSTHWEKLGMHTIFWFVNLKGREDLEELGVDGKEI
jgi:hypothetical protein